MKNIWFALLVIVAMGIFGIFAGCSNQAAIEKEIADQDADFTLQAKDLSREYQVYHDQTDEKYYKKILEVSGPVLKVYADPGYMLIQFDTGPVMMVECYFAGTHKEELLKLSEGDEVTVKGVCKGAVKAVKLEGCSFVE